MARAFQQVDVFTQVPYRGNPVAVVLDGEGLSDAAMQAFAHWTNLSETTFVLPPRDPGADYRVRIFTPSQELPFAGHPTIGTCHAWLRARGESPRAAVQECAAGLVPLRPGDDGSLAFEAPPLLRSGPVDDAMLARVASVLGIDRSEIVDARWADNGPGWVAVLLADADRLLALRPGPIGDLDIGAVAPLPAGSVADVEVRAFFPVDGATREDPVTGSLNAGIAPWLVGTGVVGLPYRARQGTAAGRDGRVYVSGDGKGTFWVGGHAVTCVEGTVDLP